MSTSWAQELAAWTQQGLTLAVAESCTGGLLAGALTASPGASAVFLGGIVAYSNAAKIALLDVPPTLIEAEGAVSEAVARAMAQGCRRRFLSDVAVSITGIAGPGGATAFKPVGLTFIAVAADDGVICHRYRWDGGRRANRERAVAAALDLLSDGLGSRWR
jgi:PncC family amidohydrolase